MGQGRVVMRASLVGILGLAVGASALQVARDNTEYAFLDPIIDAKQLISRNFKEYVDPKKLQEGAIKGMIEALDDPYTIYVPPAESTAFAKDLTGEYVGIGAQVNMDDGWLTIVSPLEESPAFRAGLMAMDRVVEIEGASTKDLPIDRCIEMLMGEPGTDVKIVVERGGERIEYTITRERIKTRSVKGVHRLGGGRAGDANNWEFMIDRPRGIAYVRLTQFTPKAAEEVLAALESAGASQGKVKGLVLDLRFNPGGVLGEAIMIADLFLREGVIVSTKGRAHAEEVARAEARGTLPDFPIAVLLNGQSASASEVLAGALVENDRAIVVGTRSFGKGSVQTVRPLGRGGKHGAGELKITEQGYYLPSGRSITRNDDSPTWGVDPSDGFFVPMTDEELIAMLDVRRREEILRHSAESAAGKADQAPIDWDNVDEALGALKDKQLSAAVRALQGKIDTGAWTKTGEASQGGKGVDLAELSRAREFRDRLERELVRAERRMAALEGSLGDELARQAEGERDLWPDAAPITGGKVQVFDRDGKLLAVLDITGANLERWLLDADVKKSDQSPQSPPVLQSQQPRIDVPAQPDPASKP